MKVEKDNFIEVDYTGRLKDGNVVFDTTDEKTAKENDIHNENAKYAPVKLCIGQGHVLAGLESELVGKDVGSTCTIELAPEKAFGKKDAKLLRLIPRNAFKKQNIEPMPGLQINMDGVFGTVINVTGGRVIVDFNHPLAGKTVVYEVKINKIIEDKAEQTRILIKNSTGLDEDKINVKILDNAAQIDLAAEIPKEIQDNLAEKIKDLVKIPEMMFNVLKAENSEKKED